MIVKFYSALREKVGKSVEINKDELDIKSLIELLDIKDYIMENNNFLTGTIVLVNGKNILHMNGLDTVVKNNDNVDFFPPAAGG